MKRFILILAGLLFCSTFSFTQADENSFSKDFSNTRKLIVLGLEKNYDLIYYLSLRLSQDERYELYTRFEQKKAAPILWNTLLGFGSGSDRQLDKFGGDFQFYTDVIGWSIAVASPLILLFGVAKNAPPERLESFTYATVATAGVGLASVLTGRIFGIIRPSWFANQYNSTLAAALHIGDEYDLSVNVQPVYNPLNNSFGLVASISF